MDAVEFGARGEERASEYLEGKGFIIRDRNWYWRHKEIDIIAQKGNSLHIIEVKTRSASFLKDPVLAVDKQKQRFSVQAAQAYVDKFQLDVNVQFDIVSVVVSNGRCRITHIPNAFYPTMG